MADNETTADIIAEMRRNFADGNPYYAAGLPDRLDAAHKRERDDAAKLREALVSVQKKIHYLIGSLNVPNSLVANRMEINGIINAALSTPPRNCDVGTAQEQDERFHRFCVKHHTGSCAGCHNPVGDYTVANGVRECALVWAQMPYEEGDAK